jgi:hypothetical protein
MTCDTMTDGKKRAKKINVRVTGFLFYFHIRHLFSQYKWQLENTPSNLNSVDQIASRTP